MAEETTEQKRPKRRLRGSSETVRERTEKSKLRAAAPKKPSRTRAFISGFFAPLRWLGRMIGKLERFRIFRWIGYVIFPVYIRNSWRELRLVTWPSRRQSLQLTNAVIIFSIIFGLLVAVVDYGLDKLFKEFIIK